MQLLIEGVDFYWENGRVVLTEKYLSDRGYCCGNGCRHCPYNTQNISGTYKEELLSENNGPRN